MLYKLTEYQDVLLLILFVNTIYEYQHSEINLLCSFRFSLKLINKVWDSNKYSLNRLYILQKKALSIISLGCRNGHSNSVLYKHKMIEHSDKIVIENCLFISKSISFGLLSVLIIGFLFPQTLIIMKHLVCRKDS